MVLIEEMHQNFEQIAKIESIVIDSMVQPLKELTKTSDFLKCHGRFYEIS